MHVRSQRNDVSTSLDLKQVWPLIALAVVLGYSFQMVTTGSEHVVSMMNHMQNREPLVLDSSQPELLLSRAELGNRVLYMSKTLMPFYFAHGAMSLGAVFYHPSMQGDSSEKKWLTRPDIRFAVTYNPAVYHPSFQSLDEFKWWITSPDFRYSTLNKRKYAQPLMRNGVLWASDFQWIQVEPKTGHFPDSLKLLITNNSRPLRLGLIPSYKSREQEIKNYVEIPACISEWIVLDLPEQLQNGFKIIIPDSESNLQVKGIVFADTTLNWPWEQKAVLTFMPRDPLIGPVMRSYDPSELLPQILNSTRPHVIDDSGSSVLLEIDR